MIFRNVKKWMAAIVFASVIGSISHLSAVPTLTIGDSRDLGLIDKNQPANPTSSASFINILLDQPLGSGPTTVGANKYTRTTNDPLNGIYPDAVFSGVEFGANVTNIDLSTGYLYLLAKYDGPNWGSQVWYVGDLTGPITIPLNGSGNQYAVSHTYLFNPQGASVPDAGATLMLLGIGLSSLAAARRWVLS